MDAGRAESAELGLLDQGILFIPGALRHPPGERRLAKKVPVEAAGTGRCVGIHEESGLTNSQRARFGRALRRFVADLLAMEEGQKTWFRPGLRVKPVRGGPDLFEMSWAPNGRATFWGDHIIAGTRHILWHRCGSHDILP